MDISNNIAEVESIVSQTIAKVKDVENRYNDAVSSGVAAKKGTKLDADKARLELETVSRERRQMLYSLPEEVSQKLNRIRADMQKKLEAELAMDPEKMDMRVVELLKMPVLTAEDVEALAAKAMEEKNYTMLRLICAEARKRAAELDGKDDIKGDRRRFFAISEAVKNIPGYDKFDSFDALARILTSGIKTPSLYSSPFISEMLEKLKK